MAYLVRRLDENTHPDNFLHDLFDLTPGSAAWDRQARAVRGRLGGAGRYASVVAADGVTDPDNPRVQRRGTGLRPVRGLPRARIGWSRHRTWHGPEARVTGGL